MQFDQKHLLLYAITDRAWTDRKSLSQQVEDALKGGITMLQLREKNLDEKTFTEEAVQMKKLCKKYNVPLIINDNVKVALESGADGVHVGALDAPVRQIRQMAGKDFIIGATAKTTEQAKKAEADGADYLGVGAVFPSPTKQTAIRITKEKLHEICTSVSIPAVAIGGIGLSNVSELAGGGMRGIAVVSAVFGTDDIIASTIKLKEKINLMISQKGENN